MTYVSLSVRCLRLELSGSLGLIRSLVSLTQRDLGLSGGTSGGKCGRTCRYFASRQVTKSGIHSKPVIFGL